MESEQYEPEELPDTEDEFARMVDFDATPEQVLDRIEQCVTAFLEELSQGRLQTIQTVSSKDRHAGSCFRWMNWLTGCDLCTPCRSQEAATMPQ